MGIVGIGTETYLYVNGISCDREINLRENVILMPAKSEFQFDKASKLIKSDIDYSIAVLSATTLSSQLKIAAADAEQLVATAWNAQWDCILLGALFNCEVMCNLQSDKAISELKNASYINVTNYAFHALLSQNYTISESDEEWIKKYYESAMRLITTNDIYRTAIHAMSSYRWHSMPRVQLAILWSGIESLFNVSTEVSFRVSLYIARFLSNHNEQEASNLFKRVKKLYNLRSSAVHGNKMKDDIFPSVEESALLLNRLIVKCAEIGSLPNIEKLIFDV